MRRGIADRTGDRPVNPPEPTLADYWTEVDAKTRTLPRRFILPSPSLTLDNSPFKLIDQPSPFTR